MSEGGSIVSDQRPEWTGGMSYYDAASALRDALMLDAPALRRIGVTLRTLRWRKVQRRLMPRRFNRWAQRRILASLTHTACRRKGRTWRSRD